MSSDKDIWMMTMLHRSGKVVKHACLVRQFTRRHLADQVAKGDTIDISPQYLFAIQVHDRAPAPYFLRETARVLELDYDTLRPFRCPARYRRRCKVALPHSDHDGAIVIGGSFNYTKEVQVKQVENVAIVRDAAGTAQYA